jgi:hypothetical protein
LRSEGPCPFLVLGDVQRILQHLGDSQQHPTIPVLSINIDMHVGLVPILSGSRLVRRCAQHPGSSALKRPCEGEQVYFVNVVCGQQTASSEWDNHSMSTGMKWVDVG